MANHIAYLGIGSNMGDGLRNCQLGIQQLATDGHTHVLDQSRFYETEPVDYLDQPWFVNGVVKAETDLDPFQLLEALKKVEKCLGRKKKSIRFGPRILDLDILLYDDRIIDSIRLVIPHPRMHQRRFVLQPICDIEDGLVHPVLGLSMRMLLKGLEPAQQGVRILSISKGTGDMPGTKREP